MCVAHYTYVHVEHTSNIHVLSFFALGTLEMTKSCSDLTYVDSGCGEVVGGARSGVICVGGEGNIVGQDSM